MDPDVTILDAVFETYNRMHASKTQALRQELDDTRTRSYGGSATCCSRASRPQTVKKQLYEPDGGVGAAKR